MNVNFCAAGYYESKPTFAVRKGRPNDPKFEFTTAWSCGARIVARDIHTLKHAEEELEIYRERMARAEQLASLGTLSATVARE